MHPITDHARIRLSWWIWKWGISLSQFEPDCVKNQMKYLQIKLTDLFDDPLDQVTDYKAKLDR